MASVLKATRGACGNLFDHYERREDIKFKNQDIDKSRSHLNYNLAPQRNLSQREILNKRLSEVKVLKRSDVNVTCNWVITLPKTIQKDSEEEKEFFKETYKFLKNEYGEKNIVSAYVHKDEVTPHMHFCFIPVVIDKKKNIEKVSAKELITKKYLKTFHNRLGDYLNNYFRRNIGILNGVTANGNRTILEIKNEDLKKDIENTSKKLKNYNITLNQIDNLKIKDIPLIKGVSGVNSKEIYSMIKVAVDGLHLDKKYENLLKLIREITKQRDDLLEENKKLKDVNKINLEYKLKQKNLILRLENKCNKQQDILNKVPDEIIKSIIENNIKENLQKQNWLER